MSTEILSNPAAIGAMSAAILAIVIYWFIRRSRPRTVVQILRGKDYTGDEVEIKDDFATTMESHPNRKPVQLFFWKHRKGYAFQEGGHLTRRYYAREGSAYTKDFEPEGGPTNPRSEVERKLPLAGALKATIGETFYNTIFSLTKFADSKKKIEDSKILVTVDLEEELTPEGYEPLSAEDVYAEGDRKSARIYNKEMQEDVKTTKSRLVDVLLGFALAAALILLAVSMKWLPVK